jgi:hypothetical protein
MKGRFMGSIILNNNKVMKEKSINNEVMPWVL